MRQRVLAQEPDDVDALVEDEARRERMGEAARELAVDRYSWSTIASRLDEIYASLVGGEVWAAA